MAHNSLTALPNEFALLTNLRYLNLRSNNFEDFPLALCLLPGLDILDISRNRLRSLPIDIGHLRKLKIFSLAKNKLTVLPKYLGEMKDLKILKVQANPLRTPTEQALDRAIGHDGQILDFGELRAVLGCTDDEVSPIDTPSSDEGPSKSTVSALDTLDAAEFRSRSPNDRALGMKQPPIPSKNQQRRLVGQSPGPLRGRTDRNLAVATPPFNSTANALISPPLNSANSERSRSRSESASVRDSRKRMGIQVKPAQKALGTVEESKALKAHHMRGFSHDSKVPIGQTRGGKVMDTEGGNEEVGRRSPTETEGGGAYFRRLSSLPERKRTSLSSARIVECARGILYSLTQANQAIQQYVSFSRDRSKPLPALESVLYNARSHTAHLISALETYEERGDERAVEPILEACDCCVQVFRHVVTQLHANLSKVALDMDIRFTRTLLLLLYGVHIELQTAWSAIRPILPSPPVGQHPNQDVARNNYLAPNPARAKAGQFAVSTPRTPDAFNLPHTPSLPPSSGAEDSSPPDEDLHENVQAATSHALATLAQIIDAVQRISQTQSLPPSTQLKIQDLKLLCGRGAEVARRLKTMAGEGGRRFWDETNFFIKVSPGIQHVRTHS